MAETLQTIKYKNISFRSHTLFYNIQITPERNPMSKYMLRSFLAGLSALHIQKLTCVRNSCEHPEYSEVFLHKLHL